MGLHDRVACCPDGIAADRQQNVRVLDCTIRDGGCTNAWRFEHDLVRSLVGALAAAGVDIVEVGYQTTRGVFDRSEVGPWRFCDEDDVRRVVDGVDIRVACMVDLQHFQASDLRPARDSVIDVLRVATYVDRIDGAVELCERTAAAGYEVHCNVMAVSACAPDQIEHFLKKLAASPVQTVSIVDSYGALYPHHLRYLVRRYREILRPDQRIGVHLHNNQGVAFANTIAAIEEGAEVVDATLLGMGRGAGNCPLELLLMYLEESRHAPDALFPLVEHFAVLREQIRWGYHPAYAITGWLNQHPAQAIAQMRSDRPYDVTAFFERLRAEREVGRSTSMRRPTSTPRPTSPQTGSVGTSRAADRD